MKSHGPLIVAALVVVLLLLMRNKSTAAGPVPIDQADGQASTAAPFAGTPFAGAPVSDSFLASWLFRGSSKPAVSTAATTSSSSTATVPTAVDTSMTPAEAREWATEQHQLGAPFRAAATASGVYPVGDYAGGVGFMSAGYRRIQALLHW